MPDSVTMTEEPRTRWQIITGGRSGADYAARFTALAASGEDTHGEAAFCATRLVPHARVLDAGCGTGRVAIRLAEMGFDVVGVDADESMLAVAREEAPELTWVQADLAALPVDVTGRRFELVVLAGNVVPLLAEGTLTTVLDVLAALLDPGALLVAGFGLDPAHLPPGCPVTDLEEYDTAAVAAGLVLHQRFGTWAAGAFETDGGYAVSVHRRT